MLIFLFSSVFMLYMNSFGKGDLLEGFVNATNGTWVLSWETVNKVLPLCSRYD